MTDISLLNDPEYRWYHKEEMSKIMPYPTERKRMGVITIDYDKLRSENDAKIKLCKDRHFNWDKLKHLIDVVPDKIDKTKIKETLQPKDRLHFEKRDMGKCAVCEQVNCYGSHNMYSTRTYASSGLSHLHHILPNGGVTDRNIITLCGHCHQVVHQILYLSGKWKYARPL